MDDLNVLSAELLRRREGFQVACQQWGEAQTMENETRAAMERARKEYEAARQVFNAALAEGLV